MLCFQHIIIIFIMSIGGGCFVCIQCDVNVFPKYALLLTHLRPKREATRSLSWRCPSQICHIVRYHYSTVCACYVLVLPCMLHATQQKRHQQQRHNPVERVPITS